MQILQPEKIAAVNVVQHTDLPYRQAPQTPPVDVLNQQQNTGKERDQSNGLLRDDVKSMFWGAPHYILEHGKHGRLYPQVTFPWNSDLDTGDLHDRKWFKHDSFAMSSLHAHLQIPDALKWHPSISEPYAPELQQRSSFDIGIFEAPNMLSWEGREAGTVGMRFFLELAVSDYRKTVRKMAELAAMNREKGHTPDGKLVNTLQHDTGAIEIGKHSRWRNRLDLIRGGGESWKAIGVRNVSIQYITARLAIIAQRHDQVVREGGNATILSFFDYRQMHHELFEQVLFPPENADESSFDVSMKVQIETLVRVLATPGAWIDLSMTHWRFRLGQLLWEISPARDDEYKDLKLPADGERRWMLVQLLLSVELRIRLDAAMRIGIAHTVASQDGELHITPAEIHHYQKLRSAKVDFDIVLARRFLRDMYVIDPVTMKELGNVDEGINLWKELKRRADEYAGVTEDSTWNFVMLPRHRRQQMDGLMSFARNLRWRNIDQFETALRARLVVSMEDEDHVPQSVYAAAVPNSITSTTGRAVHLCKWSKGFITGVKDPPPIVLQTATRNGAGGWVSRSWLSGLVMPGESTSLFLMCTLLEQDPTAIAEIGDTVIVEGGFVLDHESWWSKLCIIGRVFASMRNAIECMGWTRTPDLLPRDNAGKPLQGGWLHIHAEPIQFDRIHDGAKVAEESNVLGPGHGKVYGKEFRIPESTDPRGRSLSRMTIEGLTIELSPRKEGPQPSKLARAHFKLYEKSISGPYRNIHITLHHGSWFVAGQPCLLPPVHVLHKPSSPPTAHPPPHQSPRTNSDKLASHPLHQSFRFTWKHAEELLEMNCPQNSTPENDVYLVDAVGSSEKDCFVRAWCAHVGQHALVSRVGKQCVSCAVREAKALAVRVVVRVGE